MKEELIFETNEHLKADSKEEAEQISRIMIGIDYIFIKDPNYMLLKRRNNILNI